MMPRAKTAILALLMIVAAGQSPAGCPNLPGTTTTDQGAPLPVPPAGSILLHIDNQSGIPAVVEASFVIGTQEVRHTTRLMAPDGPESTADVIKTLADQLSVTARVGSPTTGTSSSKYRDGFLLAQSTYTRGTDFQDQSAIVFTIPPPPPDCNGNGIPDTQDIAANTSRDCNQDGIPDECETIQPSIVTCAGDVVVAADANGIGLVPDLTAMVVAVDACTPTANLILSQDVPAGTSLQLDVATPVTLTVTGSDGNKTQCTANVTLVDTTPPTIKCPADTIVFVNNSCSAPAPDLSSLITVTDNTTPAANITITQDVAPGQMVPMGTTTITFHAIDASGNASQCQMKFTVATKSIRNAQRCGVPVYVDPVP